MIACPRCGTENDDQAMNCANCRINLRWALENPAEAAQRGKPDSPFASKVDITPTRKFLRTEQERRQFWIGFVGWFGFNLVLYPLYHLVFTRDPVWALAVLAANVVCLIVLGFTRQRMALGALAAFGASLLLGLCFASACFVVISALY